MRNVGHVTILITLSPHLTVGGACHVTPVDLYDLVSRLQPPVTGHQAVREHLHHHVIMCHLSYVCYLLDHDTPEGGVRPAHYGDPETGRGAGDLHVAHLALQDRQPGDACNNNHNAMSKSLIQRNLILILILIYDDSLVFLCTFLLLLLFFKRCTSNRAFCELKENDKDK